MRACVRIKPDYVEQASSQFCSRMLEDSSRSFDHPRFLMVFTLFTIPKAFHGHTDVIQRNAINSWIRLHLGCEIILLAPSFYIPKAKRGMPNSARVCPVGCGK